ncbi:hypothetical protein EUX98_g4749 [Antrodiella citrinella]|uniref:Uncharacterized protein n=1 Tax=Antrodiella citrinella TaxID=2447956 RepID=A0A4S4MTD7_9APHY|nr:hypothetical protein EUX98_g4749 [Antrodiella citrinella]
MHISPFTVIGNPRTLNLVHILIYTDGGESNVLRQSQTGALQMINQGGRKRKSAQNRQNRSSPVEYINVYNVQTNTLRVRIPFDNAYRIIDTFRKEDIGHSDSERKGGIEQTEDKHVEELFSKLNREAGKIIARLHDTINASHDAPSSVPVIFRRAQVNTLRKFLFLIEYRSGCQFVGEKTDMNMRHEVEAFRQKHRLDNRVVWMTNLRNILESEHWEIPDNDKILSSVRGLYAAYMCSSELAFFMAPAECEFVLTDSGSGLGAVYPATPRLLIMLRRNTGDIQQSLKNTRGEADSGHDHLSSLADKFPDDSFTQDFPRTLAKVKYAAPLVSQYTDPLRTSITESRDAKIVGRRVEDRMTFRMHLLNAEQSARINYVRLESHPWTVTFKSAHKLISSIHYHQSTDVLSAFAQPVVPRPRKISHALSSLLQNLVRIEDSTLSLLLSSSSSSTSNGERIRESSSSRASSSTPYRDDSHSPVIRPVIPGPVIDSKRGASIPSSVSSSIAVHAVAHSGPSPAGNKRRGAQTARSSSSSKATTYTIPLTTCPAEPASACEPSRVGSETETSDEDAARGESGQNEDELHDEDPWLCSDHLLRGDEAVNLARNSRNSDIQRMVTAMVMAFFIVMLLNRPSIAIFVLKCLLVLAKWTLIP